MMTFFAVCFWQKISCVPKTKKCHGCLCRTIVASRDFGQLAAKSGKKFKILDRFAAAASQLKYEKGREKRLAADASRPKIRKIWIGYRKSTKILKSGKRKEKTTCGRRKSATASPSSFDRQHLQRAMRRRSRPGRRSESSVYFCIGPGQNAKNQFGKSKAK